ncbi:MAG TPA: IPT/TIG domain-containing protein, partial [Terriglobales bacterium]|nr:IPT/TIG domain-containing protein [Terriglobales bacterium]
MALTLAGTAAAQGYGRGDADCSAHQSAADILATAHGLHGDSACDNDDCDRSGTVDAADVSCSASCLFGDCRAPAHAPQITGGAPTTGSLIRAYAPLRLDGVNFAGDSALVTVEIGGVPAEIVEITGSDSIVVSVPPLLPGPTIVTVTTGDLTGPPRSIVITPQTGVGAADSFDGFLALLDLFLERLAELDLQDIYGDDTEAVLEAIAIFRDDLETQRAALAQDPQLTTELRQRIDAAIDSSGAAEILRDALDDIEAVLDGAVAGSGPRQTLVVNNAIRAARGATLVARAAGAAAGGTLLGPGALIAIGIGTLAGALTLTGAALPPIITEVVFLDRSQVRSEAIHVNGFIRIHGRRLTGSNLVLRLRRGDLVLAPEQSGPGFLQFRLAPTFGFCGSIEYFLRRALPLTGTSQRMRWRVEAELLQLLPIDPLSSAPLLGRSGQTLSMLTNGVAGCTAAARFERPNAPMGEIFSTQIRALNSSLISAPLPHVPGGEYLVEVIADTIISNALPGLTIINPIAGIDVTCSAHRLNLSPGMPDRTTCTAKLLPQSATAPFGSRLVWTSSDGGTATIEGGGSSVVVHAREPGMTRVSAILKAGNRVLAETDADVDIVVADISEPNVFAIPAPPLLVAPGATVRVAVQASDNYLVSRLVLRASGDAAVVAEQEVPCLTLESDCNAVFNVQIKETGFTDRRVTLVADAYDGSGNKGSSQDVVVSIRDN